MELEKCEEGIKTIGYAFFNIMCKHTELDQKQAFALALASINIELEKEEFYKWMKMIGGIAMSAAAYQRERMVEILLQAGLEVEVFGDSWKDSPLASYSNLLMCEQIDEAEYISVLEDAKVSLNIMYCNKGGYTERYSYSMLNGAVCVSDTSEYLCEEFTDGADIIFYQLERIEELPGKVKWLLGHPEGARRIADAAYEKAKREDTWEKRKERFLKIIQGPMKEIIKYILRINDRYAEDEMKLLNLYLEDEVREGFYVPSIVKRAWAAELKVLDEVDRVCRKHGISYFADWGTLLGAVRHHGFIPWDDDFDIVMLRKDYERFLRVAKDELPDGFAVFNYQTHDDFWHFLARVVAKPRICFEEEHLEQFYGFPYIVGIDIFILDYIAADPMQEEMREKIASYVLAVADGIGTPAMQGNKLRDNLSRIEELCNTRIAERQNEHLLKVRLYQIVEALFAEFDEAESRFIAQMMPCGLNSKNLWLPKEYYAESTCMPFEGSSIPVPIAYDAVLRRKYGDYMHSSRNMAGHDYPFFMSQRKQLEAVLDFEMPGFRFKEGMLQRKPAEMKGSLKYKAAAMEKKLEDLTERLRQGLEAGEVELALTVLENAQQMAIELGTLIEQVKGEGLETVSFLEQLCEVVYQMHKVLTDSALQEKTVASVEKLESILLQVEECMKREITDRKELVFLPYKAAYWDAMETVYRAASADPECDVYVIPVPYYDKDYLGNFIAKHDEADQFPKDLVITSYDKFDFSLHHPDYIIIQNPYDEYNPAISTDSFFYSKYLRRYTDVLIYIPYFLVDEFDKTGERAYSNMQYYCTMPGVVYADKVIVQSENMRQLYIDKLADFAGEDTRKAWEKKILGIGSPVQDKKRESAAREIAVPKKWRAAVVRPDGTRKKVLLYGTTIAIFAEYKEQTLLKLREVLSLLEEKQKDVAVLWYAETPQKSDMVMSTPEVWQEYRKLVEQYRKLGWIVVLDRTANVEIAVRLCDAYYGCAGDLARQCSADGKPVMIQNMEMACKRH